MDKFVEDIEVATMVRVERSKETGKTYLVFEICNPNFEAEIRKDWTKDVDFEMKGDKLILYRKDR